MRKGEAISLGAWAPGRPVKVNGREAEQEYVSRQQRTRVHLRLLNQNAEKLRVWAAQNKLDQQDLIDELLIAYFEVSDFGMDAQASSDGPCGKPTSDAAASVAQRHSGCGFDLINDDDKQQEPKIPSSSKSGSAGRPGAQTPNPPLAPGQLQQLPATERKALWLYSELTGNHPRARDRLAFATVAHLAEHVILAGVGMARLRKPKGRINSFSYFLGSIEETADSGVGPEFWQNVLRHLRTTQPNLPGFGGEVLEFSQDARSDS